MSAVVCKCTAQDAMFTAATRACTSRSHGIRQAELVTKLGSCARQVLINCRSFLPELSKLAVVVLESGPRYLS